MIEPGKVIPRKSLSDAQKLPEHIKEAQQRVEELRERQGKIFKIRYWLFGVGLGLIVLTGISVAAGIGGVALWSVLIVLGILLLVSGSFLSPAEITWEIRDTEIKIDLAGFERDKDEEFALRLFKAHEFELQRFYNQSLRQSRVTFAVGLLVLLAGLIIIGVAIWAVTQSTDPTSQAVIGGLGAVSGLLTNYVAAVYLKMYAGTAQTLNDFHNRLVGSNLAHFGLYICQLIEASGKQDETLSKMAEELAKG